MAIYMNYNALAVPGSVTAVGYLQWIELSGMRFGVGRSVAMEAGAAENREAGTPSISEITITKPMCGATGGLFGESLGNEQGVPVVLVIVQTSAKKVNKVAEWKLEDTIISSWSTEAVKGGPPEEYITLSFTKIEAEISTRTKVGGIGTQMRTGYNISTAEVL